MTAEKSPTKCQSMKMTSLSNPSYAAESGHWYTLNGEPAYTTIGANGKERPTTLRDARKLKLVPSVTTIIRMAAAPGLERWKAEQLLMAALTLPRVKQESEPVWIKKVWDDSKMQARVAAERGTAIHAAIEKVMRGEWIGEEFISYAVAARDVVKAKFPGVSWSLERSFAHPSGYGGKIDLNADGIVGDYKTKDGDLESVNVYDEHVMQIAAYAHGLGMPDAVGFIVFVSRQIPARVRLIEIEPADLRRGWAMFISLLDFWKSKHGIEEEDAPF